MKIDELIFFFKKLFGFNKKLSVNHNLSKNFDKNTTFKANCNFLSEQDINILSQKADLFIADRNFIEAVNCYNQIIENSDPHPNYFFERSAAYACLACANETLCDLDKSINDISFAIDLDPQNALYYWKRGVFLSYRLTIDKGLQKEEKNKLLNQINDNYKLSLERNPVNPTLWLDLLETNLISYKWEDAVASYGDCKKYINKQENKLIRAWLGCIALILTDEKIEDDDFNILFDNTISMDKGDWYVGHIDNLLKELSEKDEYKEKVKNINGIHSLFLNHWIEDVW